MKTTMIISVAMALMLAACGGYQADLGVSSHTLAADEEGGLLEFMNDQDETDFDRLDLDCGIRSDSARQIIKHRDGKDKTPYTTDDDLFDAVEEIDDVAMVGPWTMERLYDCAISYGYIVSDPDTCVPVTFYWDTEYDFNEVHGQDNLDPAWTQIIEDLLADAQRYSDNNYFDIRFGYVAFYSDDGVPVRYHVGFYQFIDLGVQLWIVYTLDSCFNVLDVGLSV